MGRNKFYRPLLFLNIAFILCSGFHVLPHRATIQDVRQAMLEYARALSLPNAAGQAPKVPSLLKREAYWMVKVKVFDSEGHEIAMSEGSGSMLAEAEQQAVTSIALKTLPQANRFWMQATSPDLVLNWVEYQGKAVELVGAVTAVRKLDRKLIKKKILEQKEYLLRQMDHTYFAFFKRYDALNDTPDKDLRTIYTASSLWTLMQLNDFQKDERIKK